MDVSRHIAESLPSDLLKGVHKELSDGWEAQKANAQKTLRRVAQANYNGVDRAVDGIGQLVARIPPESYHFWGQFFGTYDCWKDKGFLAEFLKDNPECVVKTAKKSQILLDTKLTGSK